MSWNLASLVLLPLLALLASPALAAAEVESLPIDKEPLLRVEPGGPSAFVSALAFSPDGKTLYAGGWDKVIRVWTRNDQGVFELSRSAYRVPVGPGAGGALNALALSPDGEWLAAGGNSVTRNLAGFRQAGFWIWSHGVHDPLMLRDQGTIYLFNTRDRSVRTLRGHLGYVVALTFGPQHGKTAPLLLSLAVEGKEDNGAEKQLTARLWDLDKGEAVAVLKGLPSKNLALRLPGLALWQVGEKKSDVRAAFALHDGQLRIWDPTQPARKPAQVPDLLHNLGISYLASRDRLLTAGYDSIDKQSQLSLWRIPARGEPAQGPRINLGTGYARALAPLSRQGNGTPDLAAVLVWLPGLRGEQHQYELRLAELADSDFKVREVPLWQDREARQPILAASLRGEHLAVAGRSDQTIRVYSLRDLLGNRKPSPQILRGNGVIFQHASFVRRGKDMGLLLNRALRKSIGGAAPQPSGKEGDWIFDFSQRRLTDNLAEWASARPQASHWRAKLMGDGTLQVLEGEKAVRSIVLPEHGQVTDYAVLDPGPSVKVPLLAVAVHRDGQPGLSLYDAKSGAQLREFTGHTERVQALAFSPDGRLLVSTAKDGTVCVWSLTDLDTILEQHGYLPGVDVGPVAKGTKGVKVLQVKDDSPVHEKLKAGDVLAGLVVNKHFQRLDSPLGYYEAIYQLRPGTEASLRRGDPEGADDIAFRVGQGIDERKPLFSLFVRDAARAADCEWIGWSPVGPYEASSVRAEKYLGWHFNTGDPRAPTRFADAGQYRKIYYRENLLDQLIQRGALGRLESPRLSPPILGVWVQAENRLLPQARQETQVVHQPQVEVKVVLQERPLSSLSALTWQFDNDAAKPLDLDHEGEPSFELPLRLTRGEHRIAVTARTQDPLEPPVRKSLLLRYQPLPPEIVSGDAGQQVLVRAADYTLEAKIRPTVADENVRVTIRHRHEEGEERPHTQTLAARDLVAGILPLKHKLKLRPGNNEVEVRAVHGGAPDGNPEPETGRLKLSVFYYFKAKPPVIAFHKVVPLSQPPKGEELVVDSAGQVTVHLPVVKLVGQIRSPDEPLMEAVWDRGKGTRTLRLDRFDPGKDAAFSFEQRLTLEPGKQTIRVRARTKNSEEVEHHLLLDYQPPVPVVTRLTAPRVGEIVENSAETYTITVRAGVQVPAEPRAYRAVILVNGKPVAHPPIVDEKTGTLTGTAVLTPGENRIGIEVSNAWGASSSSEVVGVWYVRPPVFVGKLEHEPVAGKALLNLKFQVLSPTALERQTVRIEVNGQESPPREVEIERSDRNRWTVRLMGVPLDAGSQEQRIALSLGNREARCREPAVLNLRSETVLPAPEAEFLDPRHDLAVSDAHVAIRFQIRSQSKLERARLLREGLPPVEIDLAGVRRVGNTYELSAALEMELATGQNRLSLEVVSVAGRLPNPPQLLLQYVPPPLRIEMERLTEGRLDGPAVEGQRQRGNFVFPKVETGSVWLHGRVSWTDEGASWREDSFRLRIFVNGFQQIDYPVRRKAHEKQARFRVRLLLNRATDNRIRLVAPRQEAGSSSEGVVDCDRPVTAQRLHILALSPYSQPREVEARLRQALFARAEEKEMPPSSFHHVKILPPLTGSYVSHEYLCDQLGRLKEEIRIDQYGSGSKGLLMNEVLLLYYEGGEKIDPTGHFFETYSASGTSRFRMRCDKMVSYLMDVPGAHVLLLDVDQAAQRKEDQSRDKIEHWNDDYASTQPHVVVMRCARRVEAGRHSQVRLIPVLQKQLPQAARLNQLIPLIEEALATSIERDLLVFTKYLPIELADLIIGPRP